MTTPAPARKTKRKSHLGLKSRVENMKRLIAEFQVCELTRKDVMALFDYSESGARKYINDMLAAGIIEPRAKMPGAPAYWITADDSTIAAYLAAIASAKDGSSIPNNARADKSRTFHVMHDDAAFKVKMHRAPVAPDPLALPAGFFAPRTDDGPRLATPVIPPKPQGFPVPGEYRFSVQP